MRHVAQCFVISVNSVSAVHVWQIQEPTVTPLKGDLEWNNWVDFTNQRPAWWRPADQRPNVRGRFQREGKQRVAVLTSGTVKRYFMMHAALGLIQPMVEQGFAVDYYVALNAENFISNRPEADEYLPDPDLPKLSAVRQMINESISRVGGRVKHIELRNGIDTGGVREQEFIAKSGWGGDPKTALATRKSVLKYTKMLELLWSVLEKTEAEDGMYNFVIILKDDSIWLKPFDLKRLVLSDTHADAFNHRCERNISSYALADSKGSITETIFVLNRTVADLFGRQYTLLMKGNLFDKSRNQYWTAHSLEGFSRMLKEDSNMTMVQTPPRLLPVQRGARVMRDDNATVVCLHYVCDGRSNNIDYLRPTEMFPPCKKNFAEIARR